MNTEFISLRSSQKWVLPEVDTNSIFAEVRSLSRTLWSPAILNLLSRLIGYSTAQGPQCEMPVETLLRSGTKIQIILVNEFDWSSATTPHCRHFATVTVAVSNPRTKTTIQYGCSCRIHRCSHNGATELLLLKISTCSQCQEWWFPREINYLSSQNNCLSLSLPPMSAIIEKLG